MDGTTTITPREGWMQLGCPTCGAVHTLPLDDDESLPWCTHSGGTYSWRDPHPETQRSEQRWTRMVRVRVEVL